MTSKIKLANNLKKLLHLKSLSESELARQTGVGQPVIHRLASGETDNPKIESLRPIAKYFSVSLDQLVGDAPLGDKSHFETPHLHHIPLLTFAEVPLWHDRRHQLQINTHVSTEANVSKLAYAIRLKDSTMSPMFPENTLLIIDPEQSYSNQDFVIVHTQGQQQATFKQLLMDGDDLYFKPINPDFQTIRSHKNCKILGVMVQARIDFRVG